MLSAGIYDLQWRNWIFPVEFSLLAEIPVVWSPWSGENGWRVAAFFGCMGTLSLLVVDSCLSVLSEELPLCVAFLFDERICLELSDRHCLNLTLSPLLLFRTRSPRKRTIALPPHNQLTDPLIVENIWWLVGQGLAQPFSWTWTWWVSIWRERFLLLTQHWSWGIFRFLACSGRNELVA